MKKLRVAFLASIFIHKIAHEIFLGINKELKKNGVELVTLIGGSLNTVKKKWVDVTTNRIYDLAMGERFDGIIIFGGSIGQFVDDSQMEDFCKRFNSTPIVNISLKLSNVPSVISSNYSSMYEVVSHLITVHNYREIAFIKGPDEHGEAKERFMGYKKALKDNNISFNDQYILPGDFSQYSGMDAIDEIYDRRKLDLDAIVCVDDETALGAIYSIKRRGLTIPGDIAVVGFDDVEIGANINPGLTTVRQSLDELGKEAARLLQKLIDGKLTESFTTIPSRVVIRESCGCIPSIGQKELEKDLLEKIERNPVMNREKIKSEIYIRFKDCISITKDISDEFIDTLYVSFVENRESKLFKIFNSLQSNQDISISKSFSVFNDFLSWIESMILKDNTVSIKDAQIALNNLRLKNYEFFYRKNVLKKITVENQLFSISHINQNLHKALTFKELFDESYEQFRLFGIDSCFVVMFNNLINLDDGARLVFGFNREGRINIDKDGIGFDPLKILPDNIYKANQEDKIIVPLSLDEDAMGYIVFEIEQEKAELTTALCWHYSSIVKRILILEEEEQRTRDLVQALEDLKKTQKKLIETERYASLGNLVSGIAHEINTPLGIGITYASLIEEKANDLLEFMKSGELSRKRLEDDIVSIITAAKGTLLNEKRAAKLVRSFKKLAVSSSSSDAKSFKLKSILEDAALTVQYMLKRISYNHKIHLKCPDDLFITSYPGSINQVLIGLVDNSVQHGFVDSEPGNIYVEAEADDDRVIIRYSDDGVGVTDKITEEIFEPFFTTKRSEGMVGLGLNAIYNNVTQILKGTIDVVSSDKGFSLLISIPADIRM